MIIVNAKLPAKEEKINEVIKQAETLINASRTHDGNISYNLYQDVIDGSDTHLIARFVFRQIS